MGNAGFGRETHLCSNLGLPIPGCVTRGMSLNLSEHLSQRDNESFLESCGDSVR